MTGVMKSMSHRIMKMSQCLRILALGAALIALTSPARAADSAFLKEVDDLPLAPGLVEQPGGTLFDAPQGRIVEASAQGRLMEVEARQFYDESLPQLGWTQVGSSTYRRDKEMLRIEYSDGTPMTVHFSLAPVRAADKDKDKDDKAKDGQKEQDKEKPKDQDQHKNPSQDPDQDEGAK
jgi:hypothetical protein